MRRLILLLSFFFVLASSSSFAQENPFAVYTVKAGDTVQSVAKAHGIDGANLSAANGLAEAEALPPAGTVLLVPKSPGDVLATLYEAKRRGLGAWPKPRYADEFLTPLSPAPAPAKVKVVTPKEPAPREEPESRSAAVPRVASATSASITPAANAFTYTIREGDTLYRISRTHGISLTSLLKANNLTETSIIRIGETITIPAPSAQKPQPPLQPEAPTKPEAPVEIQPEPTPASPAPVRLTWPLRGGPPPTHAGTSFGEGLSSKATPGDPVHAAADATVLHGGWMRNFGNAIYLNHGDGIATFYGGLGILYVKAGEKVKRGTRIALVGESEGMEPRFVFHVLREGKSVDPRPWLGDANE